MKLFEKEYKVIKNEKEGFVEEEVLNKATDYFIDYDYIVGDWAYGKLRLKGFYESTNKNVKNLNDIANVDNYIEKKCAYGCKHFILKKID